ncbi:MAG: hypoxanthine phosphoribosyltransferase [Ruminococcaceae bacterium]|nr:hypoxanthine phosphoribosyltransferase [Oscillospiraceae bacterium]
MHKDLQEILLSEQEVDEIISRIAGELDRDYAGEDKRLVLVCILKGSVVFMGELMKKITIPVEIDFMRVSSYGAGTETTGSVNIILDLLRKDLDQCDLVIVEDIIDSGRTLAHLSRYLQLKGAKSVRTCTLLDKPDRREVEFEADYVGREIPDEFVVGYGLDYDEKYRALPYVGILKREVYEK